MYQLFQWALFMGGFVSGFVYRIPEGQAGKFKEFYDQNRLHYLGGKILWYLHSKRGHKKQHADSETSPLFETAELYSDQMRLQGFDDEFKETEGFGHLDISIEDEEPGEVALFSVDINEALDALYAHDPFLFDVFTILQKPNESINSLSKKTHINRKSLTDAHRAACEFIRNHQAT